MTFAYYCEIFEVKARLPLRTQTDKLDTQDAFESLHYMKIFLLALLCGHAASYCGCHQSPCSAVPRCCDADSAATHGCCRFAAKPFPESNASK